MGKVEATSGAALLAMIVACVVALVFGDGGLIAWLVDSLIG